ncbi:MAG: Cof-type HAD-IIB family hydrolase [Mycoplasmataceae bacterium]|nr:Cof-type HAD-IIB family hydrolase [Mycoplasmataceae bacterium]
MKYAIFTDVDGTVYPRENMQPKEETIENIKQAQKKKIEVIICTGNPYMKKMKVLVKQMGVNYFIGSNGSFIKDIKNDEVIYNSTMSIKDAQKVLDIALELKIWANWWSPNKLYTTHYSSQEMKEILKAVILVDEFPNESEIVLSPSNKIELFGESEKIDIAEERLLKLGYTYSRIQHNHIEITKGDTKGTALKFLSNKLGIEIENTMAIGDTSNDHSMLENAGFSYAMANADEKTKSIAKYHTSDVKQNGLGEAIIDFMFRNRLTSNFDGQEKNIGKKK